MYIYVPWLTGIIDLVSFTLVRKISLFFFRFALQAFNQLQKLKKKR